MCLYKKNTLIGLVQMKQYLEAAVIRANSIGLWYFIIHLPTTAAMDRHIFPLHFIFLLINGLELMKMAVSSLAHCWRTAAMQHSLHWMWMCVCELFTQGLLIRLFSSTYRSKICTHKPIHINTHKCSWWNTWYGRVMDLLINADFYFFCPPLPSTGVFNKPVL